MDPIIAIPFLFLITCPSVAYYVCYREEIYTPPSESQSLSHYTSSSNSLRYEKFEKNWT